jgi:transcription-repair coupling factor (superfamily II helicase)
VCTTIIESGIDIPNCNTIIIEGADRFGLSRICTNCAAGWGGSSIRRMRTFSCTGTPAWWRWPGSDWRRSKSHSQLGAGFRIAMRDLELRGAGNLLGAEQSGHIVGVGFELYCQLLRQSVARLRGEKQAGRDPRDGEAGFRVCG